ncbi:MAG: DNA recombination protein RmuC [Candidatus Pacebacteria bacterium]|jgi:DNA recombination protein RmuC|nr:DNA recombination protein RmuC [Candidatus Paceibacterota bacterium]
MSEILQYSFLIFGLLVFFAAIFFSLMQKFKTDKSQSDSILNLERRLTDLMTSQLRDIRSVQDGSSRAMSEQMRSFTREATQIREDLKQVQDRVKDVSSFQEIFRSPKLRGQWGEASLEHILSQHFPSELYEIQHLFSTGEQVDAALKLPNGRILPIDAKFPSENFAKMVEASPEEKGQFQKKFISDLRGHIDKISEKYIIPSESTVEFALMYIPAEAIYYEIVNNIGKEFDLNSYAWSKKIIMTSPNTIYLTLRTIEHWFKDTQISRQTQNILKRLDRVQQDASKLLQDFRKLGSHLRSAVSSYDGSEKRLNMLTDKVERLKEFKETKKLKSK